MTSAGPEACSHSQCDRDNTHGLQDAAAPTVWPRHFTGGRQNRRDTSLLQCGHTSCQGFQLIALPSDSGMLPASHAV